MLRGLLRHSQRSLRLVQESRGVRSMDCNLFPVEESEIRLVHEFRGEVDSLKLVHFRFQDSRRFRLKTLFLRRRILGGRYTD
jgi:hypothetical protein